MKIPWHKRIYALYKGDDLICDGTIREISRKTGKTVDHLKWMTYPTYAKRIEGRPNRQVLVSLDDE